MVKLLYKYVEFLLGGRGSIDRMADILGGE